jgi:ABC-type sugar transport system substrate-binding protein
MSVRHLLFGSLLLLLAGCKPPVSKSEDFDALAAEDPTQVEDINATGPKIALIVRDGRDPWTQRLISHTYAAAKDDHVRLTVLKAVSSRALQDDLSEAHAKGVQGVILCAPDRVDGPMIEREADRFGFKILNTDDPIIDGKGHVIQAALLSSDFKKAGMLAANAMIATSHMKDRKWDPDQSGMLLFTHNGLQSARDIADEERKAIIKGGVSPNRIFEIPIDTMSISSAKDLATKVLRANVQVRNWFVGGMNDTVVVGGLRAIEAVHISPGRTIGVGVEGDGAIYDLQRPQNSGMVASVLLPADKIAEKAEHELTGWILADKLPVNPGPFVGVLLDRLNVRQLKSQHRLFE